MVSYTQEGKKKQRMSIEVAFGMPVSGLAFYILYVTVHVSSTHFYSLRRCVSVTTCGMDVF